MALDIRQREKDGVLILDLKGRIVVGEEASALRESLQGFISGGKTIIILNLAEVDYIDSSGLGSLVICYTSAKKQGGTIKLLNLSRRNVELLVLTKLTTVFDIHNDEQSAINSFFPNREIKKFDILEFLEQQKNAEDE